MSNVVIITGGSKGIGKALAEKYTNEGYAVHSLSRTTNKNKSYNEIAVDLTNITSTKENFHNLLQKIKENNCDSITLINNAGRLGQIANLEDIPSEDIYQSILLNTTIPLLLSSEFIAAFSDVNCKKQIISISSGAATNPYAGWSVYCSSKAAIDMMTATIAEEQKTLKNGVKAYGIRPGVVDTDMQTQIRNTSESEFKNVQRFIDLKENKQLYSPEFVADRIFNLDKKELLVSGETIDIRNL